MAKTELGKKLEALRERIEADPDFKGLTLEELQDGEELSAAKARIAELEALLEECRPFVGDAHADHIEYMSGHVNYERDLGRLDGLLKRIDAALKGEK